MGKLRLREGKRLAHTARKLQSWDLNPGRLGSQARALVILPPTNASSQRGEEESHSGPQKSRAPRSDEYAGQVLYQGWVTPGHSRWKGGRGSSHSSPFLQTAEF